ncbi:hypothetical protein P43SY_002170 [Pythium insidiosum]|uniref:Uncharacterized protein n=1 Tax=Pythium insidiosum TaxID=114742 RepID=A0AAD5Q6P7_PYTIN|nr:hypothetical protein P43SY_002170 [Pythium insidiosum]
MAPAVRALSETSDDGEDDDVVVDLFPGAFVNYAVQLSPSTFDTLTTLLSHLSTRRLDVTHADLIIPSTASPAPTTPAPTTAQPTPAPTTAQPTPAPTTAAPTPAPTPKPHMCHKFVTKLSCQFWFWCNWDKSRQACEPRF